jgi:hypothetical protein
MSPEYDRHRRFKRTCDWLDRSHSADWNTCMNSGNPSSIDICSHACCPLNNLKEGEQHVTSYLRHGDHRAAY